MEPVGLGMRTSLARNGITAPRAGDIARGVSDGEISAEEVTLAHLCRIAECDTLVHALVSVDGERALHAARSVDRARRAGRPLGPLAGVPFVVKDNLDVRGQPTSCASRSRASGAASSHATVVSRLMAHDAVLLGRANMDELALGASTQTSVFGPTRNPWDLRRSPGGSSGGCAAAVAAGMAALAVGSDTGGSIREPAAQCGVVGMAPSPDLVPVDGLVPFAPAFERVGPMAGNCADAARLLATLADRPDLSTPSRRSLRGLRVGVVQEFCGAHNQPAVLTRFDEAVAGLADAGAQIVPVHLPAAVNALEAYYVLTSLACVSTLASAVATGRAGPEVVRRYEFGRSLEANAASALADGRATRRRLVQQVGVALTRCEVLLSPTMPTTAPFLDGAPATSPSSEHLADPTSTPYTDCWTVLANLTGLASLSVPCGRSDEDGLPVGIMLSAAAGADADLLRLGAVVEHNYAATLADQ